MKFFNTEISKGEHPSSLLRFKSNAKIYCSITACHCVCASAIKEMETCLLSYRDDIERLAQVTPRRSQIFLTSRGLKNATQASSSILSFYIGSGRIHADIF